MLREKAYCSYGNWQVRIIIKAMLCAFDAVHQSLKWEFIVW